MKLLLTNSNFRNLFLGRTYAIFAQSILLICAIKWIELYTDKDLWIYVLFVALNLPASLFSIPVSSWVENKILQKVMINVEMLRIISWLLFLISFNFMNIWGVLLFIFIDKFLLVFYMPTSQSLLPQIVDKKDLAISNSINEFAFISMRILGMIITAFLIKIGFFINHLLFLGVICLYVSILYIKKIKPLIRKSNTEKKKYFKILIEGFQYIKTKVIILFLIFVYGVLWMIDSVSDVISIDYLREVLQGGSEDIAYFNSSYFIGTMVATFVLPKIYKSRYQPMIVLLPIIIYPVYYFYLSEFNLFWTTIVLFGLVGFVASLFYIYLITYIQDKVEEGYHSRVFGYHYLIRSLAIYPSLFGYVLLNEVFTFNGSLKIISYIFMVLVFFIILFNQSIKKKIV